jgi:hypothetical protein
MVLVWCCGMLLWYTLLLLEGSEVSEGISRPFLIWGPSSNHLRTSLYQIHPISFVIQCPLWWNRSHFVFLAIFSDLACSSHLFNFNPSHTLGSHFFEITTRSPPAHKCHNEVGPRGNIKEKRLAQMLMAYQSVTQSVLI